MNLVVVPFHDWRKIQKEGFRTRDAHFIEELGKIDSIRIIIVNRPTTIVEILLKKKFNLIKGRKILRKGGCTLYQLSELSYLIDYVSSDIFGQVSEGHLWFLRKYQDKKFIKFINDSLQLLKADQDYIVLNQNIFAPGITLELKPRISIFDAWDNFTKFDVYLKFRQQIIKAYKQFSANCDFWITNSSDNVPVFQTDFRPKEIHLIRNGVDISRFVNNKGRLGIPDDLKIIPKPVVGFGGKITHLIDVSLLNATMELTPNASFVFVGQILNKDVFNRIEKLPNFYYLGDKHYDEYPNYVKNFDICIIPYIVEERKKSGANTIKAYEYLASGKKVIGTYSNGLEELIDYIHIVNTPAEFSNEIKNPQNKKKNIDLEFYSWEAKIRKFMNLL